MLRWDFRGRCEKIGIGWVSIGGRSKIYKVRRQDTLLKNAAELFASYTSDKLLWGSNGRWGEGLKMYIKKKKVTLGRYNYLLPISK